MGEINLMDQYPRSKRPIDERGALITEEHRAVARQFGREFFDGDRLHGYGGYSYHPRFWQATVRRFRDHYRLPEGASVLDVGCAKGYMLHDWREMVSGSPVAGLEISSYAIASSVETVKPFLCLGTATHLPYADNSFDLVVSINTIHNLPLDECKRAVREIERVSRGHSFIVVDAWRNEQERERFLNWNLTALTYMHVDEWQELFAAQGYTGDYYWFTAE